MKQTIAGLFVVWVLVAVGISFTQRSETPMAPSAVQMEHALMLDVVQLANGRLVSVGERGLIFLSDDQGKSWRAAQHRATDVSLTAIASAGGEVLVAVGHDAVIVRSEDGGERWSLIQSAPEDEQPLLTISFDDGGYGVAAGAYGLLLHSQDGGKQWQAEELADNPEGMHINSVAVSAEHGWLAVGEAGLILTRAAGAEAWQAVDSPYPGSLFGVLALREGGWLAYGMRGHVLRSEADAQNWVEVPSGTEVSLFGGRQLVDGRIVLVGQGGEVLSSNDGGRSFAVLAAPDRQVRSAVVARAVDSASEVLLLGEAGAVPMSLPALKVEQHSRSNGERAS